MPWHPSKPERLSLPQWNNEGNSRNKRNLKRLKEIASMMTMSRDAKPRTLSISVGESRADWPTVALTSRNCKRPDFLFLFLRPTSPKYLEFPFPDFAGSRITRRRLSGCTTSVSVCQRNRGEFVNYP